MSSALTDLLASTTAGILVKVSHCGDLPASAPALLYKAKPVVRLHATAKKNNYKPCVIQSSRRPLCKVSRGCTSIPTAPRSATSQLPPECRVGTPGKYCRHFSHRVHLDGMANVIKLERGSISAQRESEMEKWFHGLPSAESLLWMYLLKATGDPSSL